MSLINAVASTVLPSLDVVAVTLLVCVLAVWWFQSSNTVSASSENPQGLPLPPSPTALPILGHLHLLASTNDPPEFLHKLSQTYGPIYHLKMGNKIAIVISNEKLAKETLVKKGKTYAGRWSGKVLMYNSDYGTDLAMAPYGERWRKLRKVAHKILTPAALNSMDSILELESLRLLNTLQQSREEPVDIKQLFLRFTCNIILSKSMGMTFSREDDPNFLMICESARKIFELAGVGGVEDYFDGTIFDLMEKRKIELLKPYKNKLHESFVLNRIKSLKANLDAEGAEGRITCYAEELLLNMEAEELTLEDIKILMVDFLLAGMDTTACTLDWIFVHLANDVELQSKAYEEILQAIQHEKRLPTFEDISEMPYLFGMMKEALRMHPPGPLGLPRMTIESDTIDNYFIPKDAQVIYNIRGIHESMYTTADAVQFRPERFTQVPMDASKEPDILEGIYAFGLGRRMCPGFHLALREMYLVLSNVIYLFKIENAKAGPISLTGQFGLTCLPSEDFKLKFKLRSPEIASLITSSRRATANGRRMSLTVV